MNFTSEEQIIDTICENKTIDNDSCQRCHERVRSVILAIVADSFNGDGSLK